MDERLVIYDTTTWAVAAMYVLLVTLSLFFGVSLAVEGPQADEIGVGIALLVLWVLAVRYLCTSVVISPVGEVRGERMIGSVDTEVRHIRSAKVIPTWPALLVIRGHRTIVIAAPIDGYDDLILRLGLGGVIVDDGVARRANRMRGRAVPRHRIG